MTIVFARTEYILNLFPTLESDFNNLESVLSKFYTIGSQIPIIEINKNIITIKLDFDKGQEELNAAYKVTSLSEQGKLSEALPLAEKLVLDFPTVSDYHRILGQIHSELGNQDDGINALIDALRWNPKNQWALIMMGNVYARHRDDIDTALVYYNQVLEIDSNDNIALNNIGANLMQLGKLDEAKEYFHKAIFANPDYPNTYFGLAMISEIQNDYVSAFDFVLMAVQNNPKKDELYKNSISLSKQIAENLSKTDSIINIVSKYAKELEVKYDTSIKIEKADDIPTAAKLELKENYHRDYHLVKYQSKYSTYPHLILHELIHLELAEDARKIDSNHLFTSNQSHKSKFFHSLEEDADRLHKLGISEKNISNYFEALHNGLNSQVFNTPIDLFIEDIIYKRFKLLRPIQFYSLFVLINEGINAVTLKEIVKRTPEEVIKVSKTYNVINAMHFQTLYGLDLVEEHKPIKTELDAAKRLYDEFLEYREDKEPGEEYELVQHWGEDLKMDGYFDLILESKYRNQTIDDVIKSVNNDPLNLNDEDPTRERKMRSFLESHTSEEVNLAVVMHMVSALEYCKG
jgi:tetratricopeptide (TPR) repeat protein